jgi:Leucine-rich repeat (LRR) protein
MRAKQSGTLNLQSRGLSVFPKDIVKFEELKVGENWWEAAELQKLDLSNNKIPDIPEEIIN